MHTLILHTPIMDVAYCAGEDSDNPGYVKFLGERFLSAGLVTGYTIEDGYLPLTAGSAPVAISYALSVKEGRNINPPHPCTKDDCSCGPRGHLTYGGCGG